MIDLLLSNPKRYIKKQSPDLYFEKIGNSNILARVLGSGARLGPWVSYPIPFGAGFYRMKALVMYRCQ